MTIPISQIVKIIPGVIGAGSNPLALNGVIVDDTATVPFGRLLSFPDADSVASYFGADSEQAKVAINYFLGFDNSTKKPDTLFFHGFARAERPAWVRGNALDGVTIDQIKTINGSLELSVNGQKKTAASLNLGSASDFSSAATAIGTALGLGSDATCKWDAVTVRFVIETQTKGDNATISDVTGTASEALGFAGAVVSQGADAESLKACLARLEKLSNNWASFTTLFNATIDEKTELAEWVNGTLDRFAYVCWDDDAQALVADSACFGNKAKELKYSGVICVYDTASLAVAMMGMAASIDWNATNGRITFAFKQQSGLKPTCNEKDKAPILLANGYSYYGAYDASGNNTYNFVYNGNMAGKWRWADSYFNQIFLNSQLQKAIIDLMLGVNSLPYNAYGYTMLRAALGDPIEQGLNNGTIATGVNLSKSQLAQIAQKVGKDIKAELYGSGYYVDIKEATAQTRGTRTSPPIAFYYCDAGSIQKIEMPSFQIQ